MSEKRVVVYANAGPKIQYFDIDMQNYKLVKRGELETPGQILQYAWPHATKPILYAGMSSRLSRNNVGNDHSLMAFKLDRETGKPTPFGKSVKLAQRPVHITVDPKSRHVLAAYNKVAGLDIFKIEEDGSLGELVPQREGINMGVFPHQVRVTPDSRYVILVTRGNPSKDKNHQAHVGDQVDPGALIVIEYNDGKLGKEVSSVKPGNGYRFGPRHVDFGLDQPWLYVSLESQNELYVYKCDASGVGAEPVFTQPLLENPKTPKRHGAGTIHVHPNGKILYCVNRGHSAEPLDDKKVVVDQENTFVVFDISQDPSKPKMIQRVDSHGMCPRTFALDPTGRVMVTGNSEFHNEKRGDGPVQFVPANLAVFKVGEDGKLEFKSRVEMTELTGEQKIIWNGVVAF